jgi:EAL domain-containing protein (putative c-di-GMP-specific phosphodiesterase class I)
LHHLISDFAFFAAGLPAVRVSVNISPRQLRSPDFIESVRSALEQSSLPAHYLELELTESMLMLDVTANIDKMRTLHKLGVRFALDDFGTGYSSLSLLQSLPLDQLKIDRSFVHDLGKLDDEDAVVQSIISLGKNLKLGLIAEGIETHAQQQRLADLGCDEFQGFFLGRSMPAQDAARLAMQ